MPVMLRWVMRLLLVLGMCGLLTRAGVAQEDPIVERMRKDVTFLASDECEGRGVGTKGLDIAAEYIAAQFAKAGLKPGGVNGTFFQPFPFATGAELEGESTLELVGPQNKKIMLKQGVDFQVLGFSAPGKFTAPLVFAGYGVKARDIAYDDYAGLDAAGTIAVVVRRLPRWNDKDRPFDGANKDELAALENKQYRAQAAKAAAVILVNDASELPKDDLMSFQLTAKGISTVTVPFVQIKRSILDDILKASTGKTLTDTEQAIDGDLKPRSAVLQGWTANLEVKVKRQEVPVKNVIAVLEGSGPLADETVIVGAHYDHLGYGGTGSLAKDKKKDIHHGADDNASGTTALLELGRRFSALKNREGRRLVFIAFTAEERGLIGSRHYCRVAPIFPLKNTTAMFNLDMVGRQRDDPKTSKAKLIVEGIGTAKEFDQLVTKLNPGFELTKKPSGYGPSDQDSFYSQKIPVLFFWTGVHEDYHRPSDTSDRINVAGMKLITDYAQRVITELRTESKRPEYVYIARQFVSGGGSFPKLGVVPDYEFGGKGLRIDGVSKDGPAEKAGLKKGDIIVEIAGKAVPDVNGYMAVLKQQRPGASVDIRILRDSKELQLKVTPK